MSITSQRLLVLGSGNNTFDVTPFITVPSYKVNNNPLGDSWQDSNWYGHVDIVRYKASGTCTVWFDDVSDFERFTDFIETNKGADGYITASLYCNKTHTVKSNIQVMIQWDPANDLPFYSVKQHSGYDLTIEEK